MAEAAKGKRRPPSVKWKIFAFLLGFCVLLLVILWLFQTVFLDSFYTSIKLGQVESEAGSLAALLQQGDTETFEARVRERGDLFVELVDGEGNSSVVQGPFPEGGFGLLKPEVRARLYEMALANGGSVSLPYDGAGLLEGMEEPPDAAPPGGNVRPPNGRDKWHVESVLYGQIVTTPAGETNFLIVSAGITPVNATVETLRVQLWYISGIMLALAIGIALLIAKRVAKPIEKLNGAAKQLGGGNYGVTFEGEGYREIAELSGTLNHAARELSKTEELRRDLIANVSHDLRTPLTLITGYAEMMRDIPGENNPENMQIIIDEAKRLSSLVGDLLDLSRLQSGTGELHFERFNLTGEISGIIERFSKFSGPEGFTVLFEHNADVYVEADYTRITQVIYNFLINAMAHGGGDKTITVRLLRENGRARVEVADTGEGIPPEQLPYIWDRYYKIDKVHKRAAAGAGLGLSIVKSILEQHPGVTYGVQSAPGAGSVFWFTLPVVE